MKYVCIVALFLVSLTVVPEVVMAQKLSKKERKRLKKEQKKRLKELKKMDPAAFREQQDKTKELAAKASELESELTSAKNELSQKDAEVKQVKDQVRRLQDELQQAKAEANAAQENVPVVATNGDAEYNQGLVFRVQIGAYQNQDLSNYDTSENFTEETAGNGVQQYTLGNFRDYWEADKFKKYLRAMGVKDAWIVPYRDGGRVPIKDVLEDLRSNNPSSAASVN
ncbi:Ezrin/radixin/moesin family protein [Tunicatimonas pelagia]|uniref:Ezrin/radixin/moesin family protein n=1 Tax=Tunicatimonas pelagia TaxID=931531 RepID=UPI00266567F1|nr:Ezrin/radixin/moesin family protein [Tunicatimonas pelagia]WKN45172.1 Ezrin/radixin/moesin family protein [Tunicatimonas pelagia]